MSRHRQFAYWDPGFCQNILLRGEMKKREALPLHLLNAFMMLAERNKHHEIHNFVVHTDFLRSSFLCVLDMLICEFVDSCFIQMLHYGKQMAVSDSWIKWKKNYGTTCLTPWREILHFILT